MAACKYVHEGKVYSYENLAKKIEDGDFSNVIPLLSNIYDTSMVEDLSQSAIPVLTGTKEGQDNGDYIKKGLVVSREDILNSNEQAIERLDSTQYDTIRVGEVIENANAKNKGQALVNLELLDGNNNVIKEVFGASLNNMGKMNPNFFNDQNSSSNALISNKIRAAIELAKSNPEVTYYVDMDLTDDMDIAFRNIPKPPKNLLFPESFAGKGTIGKNYMGTEVISQMTDYINTVPATIRYQLIKGFQSFLINGVQSLPTVNNNSDIYDVFSKLNVNQLVNNFTKHVDKISRAYKSKNSKAFDKFAEAFYSNPEAFAVAVAQSMRKYGVNISDVALVESLSSDTDVESDLEEDGVTALFARPAEDRNPWDGVKPRIKFLLFTTESGTKSVLGNLMRNDPSKLHRRLVERMADKTESQMLDELGKMSDVEGFKWAKDIKTSLESNMDLRHDFISSYRGQQHNSNLALINPEKNTVRFKNMTAASKIDSVVSHWRYQVNADADSESSAYTKDDLGHPILDDNKLVALSTKIFPKGGRRTSKQYGQFLHSLGMGFDNNYTLNNRDQNNVNALFLAIIDFNTNEDKVSVTNVLTDPRLTGYVRALAESASKFSNQSVELQVTTPEGKKAYSVTLPNEIGRVFNTLHNAKTLDDVFENVDFFDDDYVLGSAMMRSIVESGSVTSTLAKFKWDILGGVQVIGENEGSKTTSLTDGERTALAINAAYDTTNGSKYLGLQNADKRTTYMYSIPIFNVGAKTVNSFKLPTQAKHIIDGYLFSEVKTMVNNLHDDVLDVDVVNRYKNYSNKLVQSDGDFMSVSGKSFKLGGGSKLAFFDGILDSKTIANTIVETIKSNKTLPKELITLKVVNELRGLSTDITPTMQAKSVIINSDQHSVSAKAKAFVDLSKADITSNDFEFAWEAAFEKHWRAVAIGTYDDWKTKKLFNSGLANLMKAYRVKDDSGVVTDSWLGLPGVDRRIIAMPVNTSKAEQEGAIKRLAMSYSLNYMLQYNEQARLVYGDPRYTKSVPDYSKRLSDVTSNKKECRNDDTFIEELRTNQDEFGMSDRMDGKTVSKFVDTQVLEEDTNVASIHVESMRDSILSSINDNMSDIEKAEVQKKADDIYDAYSNINEADGYGYVSLDAYRDIMYRAGDWNQDFEKVYRRLRNQAELLKEQSDAIAELEAQAAELRTTKGNSEQIAAIDKQIDELMSTDPLDTNDYLTPEELGLANKLVQLKTQIAGKDSNKQQVFYKHSLGTYIPQAMRGTSLQKLFENMLDNKTDILQYASGTKKASPVDSEGNGQPYYFENNDGSFDFDYSNDPAFQQKINFSHVGIQVDMKAKAKNEVTFGTQMMKIIFNNLTNNPEFADRFDDYVDLLNDRFIEGLETVTNDLGLDVNKDGDNPLEWTFGITPGTSKKLADLLMKDAIEKDSSDNVKENIQQLGEGTPLDKLNNRREIEQILSSMIEKRIIKFKMNGEAYVQQPSTGWEFGSRSTVDINGKLKKTSSSRLHFYSVNNGRTLPMQVGIPLPKEFYGILNGEVDVESLIVSKQLGRLFKNNEFSPKTLAEISEEVSRTLNYDLSDIDLTRIGSNANPMDAINEVVGVTSAIFRVLGREYFNELTNNGNYGQVRDFYDNAIDMVGFRIPTQAFNSIEYPAVGFFIDPAIGTSIVLPSEITAKSGSDYDIDKLFVFRKEYRVDAYGKIKSSGSLSNQIMDKQTEILDDAALYDQLITPLDTANFDEVSRGLMNDSSTMGKAFIPSTQEALFKQFMSSASIVGIAAVHGTGHSLAQAAKLTTTSSVRVTTTVPYTKLINGEIVYRLRYDKDDIAPSDWKSVMDMNYSDKGGIDLWKNNTVDGRDISILISEILTGGVDVVNDPWLPYLNIGDNNANMILTLIRSGAKIDDIVSLVNNPLIVAYTESKIRNKAFSTDVQTISYKDRLGNKVTRVAEDIRVQEAMQLNGGISIGNMRTRVNGSVIDAKRVAFLLNNEGKPIANRSWDELTPTEKAASRTLLEFYKNFNNTIASSLSDLTNVTKADTRGMGGSMVKNLINNDKIDDITNENSNSPMEFYSRRRYINEGIHGPFNRAVISGTKIMENFFDVTKSGIEKATLLGAIRYWSGYVGSQDKLDALINKYVNARKSQLDQKSVRPIVFGAMAPNALLDLNAGAVKYSEEIKDMSDIDKATYVQAKMIEKNVNNQKAIFDGLSKLKKSLPNNEFAKQLIVDIAEGENGYRIMQTGIVSNNKDSMEMNAIFEGFQEIVEKQPNYAKLLLELAIVQTGRDQSRLSLNQFIPTKYWNTNTPPAGASTISDDAIIDSLFVWNNTKFISSVISNKSDYSDIKKENQVVAENDVFREYQMRVYNDAPLKTGYITLAPIASDVSDSTVAEDSPSEEGSCYKLF